MLIGCLLIGLILSTVLSGLILKKTDIFKCFVTGIMMFFSIYIIITGLFLWMDKFSILKATLFSTIVEVIIILAIFTNVTINEKKINVSISIKVKKYIYLAILLVAAALISESNKEGMYQTGQDQGLYQFKAIQYINDINGNVGEFEEYYKLSTSGEQIAYLTKLSNMVGISLIYEDEIKSEDIYQLDLNRENLTGYRLHGIYLFPAILGLWGKIFGISNMTGVLTLMYLLVISGVYFICENLKLKKYICNIGATFMALCPIVLWCSRITLTEIVLTMLMVYFLVLVCERDKHNAAQWSIVPLLAMEFYHVTIVITLPMFILIYLVLFYKSRNKGIIVDIVVMIWGFVLGLCSMLSCNDRYVYNNYNNVYQMTGNALNKDNMVSVFISLALIGSIFIIVIVALSQKIKRKLRKKASHQRQIIYTMVNVFFVVVAIARFVLIINNARQQNLAVSHVTIIGLAAMTGYILLPMALIGITFFAKEYIDKYKYVLLGVALLYTLIIYAEFVFPNIYLYYYYARYFAPYMVLVIINGMILLNKMHFAIAIPVCLGAGIVIVIQNNLLFTQQDLTYAEFETLESIKSCVGERDVVLLRDDEFTISDMYMLPIEAVTGADVFFFDYNNIDTQIEELNGLYENIYYFCYDYGYADDKGSGWKHVYQQKTSGKCYDQFSFGVLPYPTESIDMKSSIGLYRYIGVTE